MASIDSFVKNTLEGVSGLGPGHVAAVEQMTGVSSPFSAFSRQSWDEEKALDGFTGLQSAGFDLDIVAGSVAAVAVIEAMVISAFRAKQQTTADGLLIESVDIRQVSPDLREINIGQFRRAYDLQINFQELITNE